MKNTDGSKEKKNETALRPSDLPQRPNIWAIIIAIAAFALISWVYFYPVMQGKRVKQHDMEMHKGMAQELTQYRESTGETALWTNSAFSGMPAWNITAPQKTNLFQGSSCRLIMLDQLLYLRMDSARLFR